MLHALLLLAAIQQPAPAIAKVAIQPAEVAITVGDSVRLTAVAVDAAGKPVRDVTVRWFQDGGRFEGKVDSVTARLDRRCERDPPVRAEHVERDLS